MMKVYRYFTESILTVILSMTFFLLLCVAYHNYVSVVFSQGVRGVFRYQYDFHRAILSGVTVFFLSFCLGVRLKKPSDFFILIIFYGVLVPSLVLYSYGGGAFYFTIYCIMSFIVIVSIVNYIFRKKLSCFFFKNKISEYLVVMLMVGFYIATLAIFFMHGGVHKVSFSLLSKNVYLQRSYAEKHYYYGALGYFFSWVSIAINPAFLAYVCYKKKWLYLPLPIVFQVFIFSISGQKSILFLILIYIVCLSLPMMRYRVWPLLSGMIALVCVLYMMGTTNAIRLLIPSITRPSRVGLAWGKELPNGLQKLKIGHREWDFYHLYKFPSVSEGERQLVWLSNDPVYMLSEAPLYFYMNNFTFNQNDVDFLMRDESAFFIDAVHGVKINDGSGSLNLFSYAELFRRNPYIKINGRMWASNSSQDKIDSFLRNLNKVVHFNLFLELYIKKKSIFTVMEDLLIRRTLFDTANMQYLYFGYFHRHPKTYFSEHGVSLIESYPYALPYTNLIGECYFNNKDQSANAGFIATAYMDGGLIFILFFSVLVGLLFSLIDVIWKNGRLPLWVAILIVIGPSWSLKSSDLLTTMVSHGFMLSMIFIWLMSAMSVKNLSVRNE